MHILLIPNLGTMEIWGWTLHPDVLEGKDTLLTFCIHELPIHRFQSTPVDRINTGWSRSEDCRTSTELIILAFNNHPHNGHII